MHEDICLARDATSFELEWTQGRATWVLSPGQMCPSALVQQGRKQARGPSSASGVSGENSPDSKFFSLKKWFFAFQAGIEDRRKEHWPEMLTYGCALFFFCLFFFKCYFLHSRYKGYCPKCSYHIICLVGRICWVFLKIPSDTYAADRQETEAKQVLEAQF